MSGLIISNGHVSQKMNPHCMEFFPEKVCPPFVQWLIHQLDQSPFHNANASRKAPLCHLILQVSSPPIPRPQQVLTMDILNGMAHMREVVDCTLINGKHASHLETTYSPIFNQESGHWILTGHWGH